ncbi:MAG: crosslink repair DNA glycosylase YcaQ family protein [Saprospiraceae bacterium]
MKKIKLAWARSFILNSQLLLEGTVPAGKLGVMTTIGHLGYVQIDTISVVERSHHHVLWTRVPAYQPLYLTTLEKEKAVFEYWAHAASYLPISSYRFTLLQKASVDDGSGFWRLTEPRLAAHILDRIGREGPLMSRDFEKEGEKPDIPWMIPAINQVIRQLFMKGEIMAVGRKGFQKIYDLPGRALPERTDTSLPSRKEYVEWIIRRDLRAHGLMRLKEFGYLLKKINRQEKEEVLKQMLRTGLVKAVSIESMGSEPYYALAEPFEQFEPKETGRAFHILSPFDNLIIQRQRLKELFGFDYTLECYVPAHKRKFGYFGLPLLYGSAFLGQIDAKADRPTKTLLVKNIAWINEPDHAILEVFKHKLKAFAEFNGCREIRFPDGRERMKAGH